MPVVVKICGLTRRTDVSTAITAGADVLGFVLTTAGCRLSDRAARDLIEGITETERIAVVGAVSEPRARAVAGLGFDGIQAVVTADALTWMRPWWADASRRPYLLPVFFDGADLVARIEAFVAGIVPPGPRPGSLAGTVTLDSARGGGTGTRADWARAASAARRWPVTLAGGLRPDNLAEALATVNPHGLDVSSGVASGPRRKDPAAILAFVTAARKRDARLPARA